MLKYIADKGAEMTYCEIGFNSGHSAATVLSTNPHSKVVAFDLGNKSSKAAKDYLDHKFPGRLHVIWGNSTKTVPAAEKPEKCDAFLVDGGHSF